ncbi:sensor histidine kinase [Candidatus Latescibacterota bacterium]
MTDEGKSRAALLEEVIRLRQRVLELEGSEDELRQAQEDLRRRVEEHTARYDASLQQEIDQRRRAEERLEDSETRFRRIFEYSNDAILLIDPDLNAILDTNPRACGLLGYTCDELLNLPISVIFPDEMARLQAFALSVAEEGHGWTDELTCMTRTGDRIDAEMSASEIDVDDHACIIALVRDITERKRADEQIRSALQEKEVLLREIHHRVKNNLQVVSSLFDLQMAQTEDAVVVNMLKDCRNRVRSMAIIHDKLYHDRDLARIDFGNYIRALAVQIFKSYGVAEARVQLELDIGGPPLDVDTAIPCGLIINELMSNSLKYAFPDGRPGRVGVRLGPGAAQNLVLAVWDDGVGLPEDVDFQQPPSLGLRLVGSLVHQLNGALELDRIDGTSYTLSFPFKG